MKLTILDFAVIAVPLVIALIARFSRPREISRQIGPSHGSEETPSKSAYQDDTS